MKILVYDFEGPFASSSYLQDRSGVYVILGDNGGSSYWKVVDVGESEQLKTRIANHDRTECWEKEGYSNPYVGVFYTDEKSRMKIAKEIRNEYNPPCGKH